MAALVDVLADLLAAKYSIDTSEGLNNEGPTRILVDNIGDLQQVVAVNNFLASLSVVARATLIEQQGRTATYELHLLGESQDLVNALALDERMRPQRDQFGQVVDEQQYVWRP